MDKETVLFTMIGELYFKMRILEDKLEDKDTEINELKALVGATPIITTEERAEND